MVQDKLLFPRTVADLKIQNKSAQKSIGENSRGLHTPFSLRQCAMAKASRGELLHDLLSTI